jgi:hypothetical protein
MNKAELDILVVFHVKVRFLMSDQKSMLVTVISRTELSIIDKF